MDYVVMDGVIDLSEEGGCLMREVRLQCCERYDFFSVS